jgi:hypothetical protein
MNQTYKLITDYPTGTGAMPLLYSIRDGVPLAFSALLFILFVILFAGNYFLIKNRTGRAKMLIALMASSFFTLVLSMLLALAQLVTFVSVLFYAFLTIVVFILFILSDNT